MLVAESDFLSIVDQLNGDIIICDYNSRLLNFIDEQILFLLEQFRKLSAGELHFREVTQNYHKWFTHRTGGKDTHRMILDRMHTIGKNHFLFSKSNFVRAMKALGTKNVITLEINLFNDPEQRLLCSLLVKEGIKINLCHLTNLPDFDAHNQLLQFLKKLPWNVYSQIMWSIHDRGPVHGGNINAHYVFACQSVVEYEAYYAERPALFAVTDYLTQPAITYVDIFENTRYTNEYPFAIDDMPKRQHYYRHLGSCTAMTTLAPYQLIYPPRNDSSKRVLHILSDIETDLYLLQKQMRQQNSEDKHVHKEIIKKLIKFENYIEAFKKTDLRAKPCILQDNKQTPVLTKEEEAKLLSHEMKEMLLPLYELLEQRKMLKNGEATSLQSMQEPIKLYSGTAHLWGTKAYDAEDIRNASDRSLARVAFGSELSVTA